jgi:hypothetical protein
MRKIIQVFVFIFMAEMVCATPQDEHATADQLTKVSSQQLDNSAKVSNRYYCGADGCEEPERNRCTFDKNTVPWVEQKVPALHDAVNAATLEHLKMHYGSVVEYSMPGNFFWEAMGVSELFDKPGDCCGVCNNHCSPPIKFKKFQINSAGATFDWVIDDGKGELKLVSKSVVKDIRLSITYRKTIKGESVIWADGAEYFFGDGYEPMVEYEVNNSGVWKKWFVGRVSCFAPAREVTVVRAGSVGKIPNTDLILLNDDATPPSP